MSEFSLHFYHISVGLGIAMHFFPCGRVICFAWNERAGYFMDFDRSVESAIRIGRKFLANGFTMEQVA